MCVTLKQEDELSVSVISVSNRDYTTSCRIDTQSHTPSHTYAHIRTHTHTHT